jgi:hypothetical protein
MTKNRMVDMDVQIEIGGLVAESDGIMEKKEDQNFELRNQQKHDDESCQTPL